MGGELLVIWEKEVNDDIDEVRRKIERFIG